MCPRGGALRQSMMSERRDLGSAGWIGIPSVLLVLWALFIVYGTMLPFNFSGDLATAGRKLRSVGDTLHAHASIADVVSNVLLFVPWGILFAWMLGNRGYSAVVTGIVATAGGVLLSGLVELAQLFLPSRTTSLIDLGTNTLGAALGAIAGWPLVRAVLPVFSPPFRKLVATRPLAACAAGVALGLFVAGLSPYDVSLDMGSLKASVKRTRPIPFGPQIRGPAPPAEPWSWALETITWTLAGGVAALALAESNRQGISAMVAAIGLCTILACAIEATQVVIPGRTVDATSIFFAAVGSLFGAAAVTAFPGRDTRRWVTPALTVWALGEVLSSWTPPGLKPWSSWSLGFYQFVPFWAYYQRTDIYALADLINQVLGFIPLGVLIAAWGARRPALISLLAGLAIGLFLEAGQLFVVNRTGEVTDAISGAVGAYLGARLWGWGLSLRAQERPARVRVRVVS